MSKLVTVTGATGRLGSHVARRLLERGYRVRVLTRNPTSVAARQLSHLGAAVTAGDFGDPPSLRPAVEGADSVFVVSTPHHGIGPDAETRYAIAMADAAAAAGAKFLIYSSAAGANQKTGVPFLESKRKVEDHLGTLGVEHAVLAPAYFMENLLYPWNLHLLRAGRWPLPFWTSRPLQLVSVTDVASLAVLVIERQSEFAGSRIDLAGDERTATQAAEDMSRILGHPVTSDVNMAEELGEMAPSLRLLAEVESRADPAQLRLRFPEVDWHSLTQWASAQQWMSSEPPSA